MKFSDLLKQPLPSSLYKESDDDDMDFMNEDDDTDIPDPIQNECGDDCWDKECTSVESDDDDDFGFDYDDSDEPDDDSYGDSDEISGFNSDDDDDIKDDLEDLSDDELDQLAQDINDSDIDDLSGDAEPVELTPEEEIEADDVMSVAATSELIKGEMNAEERAEFLESAEDISTAIQEGFLLESDIDFLESSVQPITEAKWYATRQRIQLGKEARMKQLWALAVQVSARAHNDPDYKKLKKIYRLKRLYRSRLEKKYNNEAKKRMRVYIARLKKSKSKPLADLGKKVFPQK